MMTAIVNAIGDLLGGLVDALPVWVPPEATAVNSLGHYLRVTDYFVPIAGPMAFTVGMLAALPAFLALRFAMMVWSLTRGGGPS